MFLALLVKVAVKVCKVGEGKIWFEKGFTSSATTTTELFGPSSVLLLFAVLGLLSQRSKARLSPQDNVIAATKGHWQVERDEKWLR